MISELSVHAVRLNTPHSLHGGTIDQKVSSVMANVTFTVNKG
jgi:hypothetical protein